MEKIGLKFEDIYLLKLLAQEKLRKLSEDYEKLKYKLEITEDEDQINYIQERKREKKEEMEKYRRIIYIFETAELI